MPKSVSLTVELFGNRQVLFGRSEWFGGELVLNRCHRHRKAKQESQSSSKGAIHRTVLFLRTHGRMKISHPSSVVIITRGVSWCQPADSGTTCGSLPKQ